METVLGILNEGNVETLVIPAAIASFAIFINYFIRKNATPAVSREPAPQASRGGFTLIELLVYMAIMGFIIVVAGKAYSDSTSMRVRSQNMLKSSEENGRVAAILKEDISQMGTKVYYDEANLKFQKAPNDIYIAPDNANDAQKDSSSYTLKKGTGENADFDTLSFRKVQYVGNGELQAVVEIEWKVNNENNVRTLVRKCDVKYPTSGNISECDGTETQIAKDISMFKFLPSKPGAKLVSGASATSDTLFPQSTNKNFKLMTNTIENSNVATSNISTSATKQSLNGFSNNYVGGACSQDNPKYTIAYLMNEAYVASECEELTFEGGEEYAIDFELPYNNVNSKANKLLNFVPGSDHLSVGLKKGASENSIDIPDFLFYPPLSSEGNVEIKRHFEFGVKQTTKACVAITIAFCSPEAYLGQLDIHNFTITKKQSKVFHFDRDDNDYPSTPSLKKNVKAFELVLGIDKKHEVFQDTTTIPIPNNGITVPN